MSTRDKKPPADASPTKSKLPIVLVLSDSTGNLARHMLATFLTQFPPDAISLRFETFIHTLEQLHQTLDSIVGRHAAICHAVVTSEFKKAIEQFGAAHRIPCCDLTGGIMEFLERSTGIKANSDVHQLHEMNEAYERRISALEFTLNHDDGLGLETIDQADIVLVGISRTSKTPTSVYLAQQGFRVANVSLAIEVTPPAHLEHLTGAKVVGLLIDADQLAMIRARRANDFRSGKMDYHDPDHVSREIAWSRRLFQARHWPILDVTDQAIEETAGRILNVLKLNAPVQTDHKRAELS